MKILSQEFKFISKLIYILPKQLAINSIGDLLLLKSDLLLNPFGISTKPYNLYILSNSSLIYRRGRIDLNYYWFSQYSAFVSIEDRTKILKRFLIEYGYIKL